MSTQRDAIHTLNERNKEKLQRFSLVTSVLLIASHLLFADISILQKNKTSFFKKIESYDLYTDKEIN